MPEHSIDDLLRRLDDSVAPDAAFEARLRQRLRRELDGSTTEEVFEVETMDIAHPQRTSRWLPAAAAVAVAAIAVATFVTTRGDDAPTTTAGTAEQTFVGANVEAIAIERGRNPYFVAVGEDVWVLSLAGELNRVDATSGEVEKMPAVPESSPLAVDRNAVWVAGAVDGDVLRLDLETGKVVARIPTGVEVLPRTIRMPMLMGESRRFASIGGIAADGGSVWVGDLAGAVLHIDPATNEVDRRIPVDVRPDALRLDGDRLLVINRTRGEAAVVDVTTGDLVFSEDGIDDLVGAALHDGAVYLHDGSDGTVTRVDLATGERVSSEPLGEAYVLPMEPTLAAMLVVTDAGVLVDSANGSMSMHVLDPLTLERLGGLAVEEDHGDMTLAPDGSAWLVRTADRDLVHIEPRER